MNLKTKKIKINNVDYEIRLFKAIEGLEFLDNLVIKWNNKESFSFIPYIDTLLTLASPISSDGKKLYEQKLTKEVLEENGWITNPLHFVELAREILNFQLVFIEDCNYLIPEELKQTLKNILQPKI